MKVALFGGRFDPIHNGHLAVAKEVLKMHAADEVWLSIENQHQWRPIVASVADRKKMVELASTFSIDLTPVELGGTTETIKVVRALRQKYPNNEFVFVVGSDQPFSRWTRWDELEKEVHFLVVARKGSPMEHIPSNATVIADPTYEPLDDSATRIRERIQAGQSITGLVPKKVEEYIIEKGLYK